MNRVTVDACDVASYAGIERRNLGEAVETDAVALNHYAVDPGERIAGLHTHLDQEEVFVVLSGSAVFETLDGKRAVTEDEAIRFAPGEFQSCTNRADERLVVLAVGAPAGTDELRVPVGCHACEADAMALEFAAGEERLVCPECDAERVPECPECGGGELRAELVEGRPASVCQSCGAADPAR
ncbi:cupin domain-containing protein [Natronomonas halophila]|uniref:cupin domain-containing protein n=1 Tax=Natronomonas halophila TaxID=2747817 RepID=UPI0015B50BEB|nr:cupin domain-containing protein [Natronomonas halophila]QLD86025.1 cupin domain-containing protein [Natronomonas halophila]